MSPLPPKFEHVQKSLDIAPRALILFLNMFKNVKTARPSQAPENHAARISQKRPNLPKEGPPMFELNLRERLQRHPLPVSAWFSHSLVLTYAFPSEILEPLAPARPGTGYLARLRLPRHRSRADPATPPQLSACCARPRLLPQRLPHLHAARRGEGDRYVASASCAATRTTDGW